eukprot:scaffold2140_cov394-Prasinococcus_capsulatus_cf.AAC.31
MSRPMRAEVLQHGDSGSAATAGILSRTQRGRGLSFARTRYSDGLLAERAGKLEGQEMAALSPMPPSCSSWTASTPSMRS